MLSRVLAHVPFSLSNQDKIMVGCLLQMYAAFEAVSICPGEKL
jgi:hypothetical protein